MLLGITINQSVVKFGGRVRNRTVAHSRGQNRFRGGPHHHQGNSSMFLRVLGIVLVPVVLVVSILADVEAIAVQALVVREPRTLLLRHGFGRLDRGGLRVVHDLWLSTALRDVRVLVHDPPKVTLVQVSQKAKRWTLVLDRKDDVA